MNPKQKSRPDPKTENGSALREPDTMKNLTALSKAILYSVFLSPVFMVMILGTKIKHFLDMFCSLVQNYFYKKIFGNVILVVYIWRANKR
jgi:hypothetical protein